MSTSVIGSLLHQGKGSLMLIISYPANCLIVMALLISSTAGQYPPPQCENGLREWSSMRSSFRTPNYVFRATTGGLSLCPRTGPVGCCRPDIESEMLDFGKNQLQSALWLRLSHAMYIMGNDSLMLSDYYNTSIDKSMESLNQMFSSTYGYNYKHNKEFFIRFFQKLKDYMSGKEQNISGLIDGFFEELRDRVIRIYFQINSAYDNNKVDCITEGLKGEDHFKGVPTLVKKLIERAFPQARMFVNAVALGREMLQNILRSIKIDKLCVEASTRMKFCHICAGNTQIGPCSGICTNIMNGCFVDLLHFNEPWKAFIDAMKLLTQKLEMAQNYPNVNSPLKVHISDAIMNLHTLLDTRKSQISTTCAVPLPKPIPMRVKRQATGYGEVPDLLTPWARNARIKYDQFRGLFDTLAVDICSQSQYAFNARPTNCWNGTHIGKYLSPVVDNSVINQRMNPILHTPFQYDFKRVEGLPRELSRLQDMTSRLISANSDRDPNFISLDDQKWDQNAAGNAQRMKILERNDKQLYITDGGSGDALANPNPNRNAYNTNPNGNYYNPNGNQYNPNLSPNPNVNNQNPKPNTNPSNMYNPNVNNNIYNPTIYNPNGNRYNPNPSPGSQQSRPQTIPDGGSGGGSIGPRPGNVNRNPMFTPDDEDDNGQPSNYNNNNNFNYGGSGFGGGNIEGSGGQRPNEINPYPPGNSVIPPIQPVEPSRPTWPYNSGVAPYPSPDSGRQGPVDVENNRGGSLEGSGTGEIGLGGSDVKPNPDSVIPGVLPVDPTRPDQVQPPTHNKPLPSLPGTNDNQVPPSPYVPPQKPEPKPDPGPLPVIPKEPEPKPNPQPEPQPRPETKPTPKGNKKDIWNGAPPNVWIPKNELPPIYDGRKQTTISNQSSGPTACVGGFTIHLILLLTAGLYALLVV